MNLGKSKNRMCEKQHSECNHLNHRAAILHPERACERLSLHLGELIMFQLYPHVVVVVAVVAVVVVVVVVVVVESFGFTSSPNDDIYISVTLRT